MTVGELLDVKRIDMPIRQTSVTFKRAPKAGQKAAKQRALYSSDDN